MVQCRGQCMQDSDLPGAMRCKERKRGRGGEGGWEERVAERHTLLSYPDATCRHVSRE